MNNLKVLSHEREDIVEDGREAEYELGLTNYEVKRMFEKMVRGWFAVVKGDYNDFEKSLLQGELKAMNAYMNRVALSTFSYFDTGKNPSDDEPERFAPCYDRQGIANGASLCYSTNMDAMASAITFYHGFVLRLMVDLQDRYVITSNRESGFGRYDVMLEPKKPKENDGIILEFKVYDHEDEETLKDKVKDALAQIEKKQYEASLVAKGIPQERIRKYGFAFEGKKVLIG